MIFEKIKKIISSKTGINKDTITLESAITDDLSLDSIEIFEILSEIEDEFSIEVEEEAYDSIKTVQDLVSYVENALEQA
ncbi:putative acyl carrier protein [Peptostreptococcaceae bacterium AS15]|jgi:acyl carrier protein 1|nr:putative acyl carrier protein [[Eubacterium] yurii subsp. margaretiae ATCC 43715]EJP26106.1 putative acyl carrier protein [Peptostreptococcaceae bacterium AS15]SKC38814.1 acyl carrier protein [[Eubacterium] yurii]